MAEIDVELLVVLAAAKEANPSFSALRRLLPITQKQLRPIVQSLEARLELNPRGGLGPEGGKSLSRRNVELLVDPRISLPDALRIASAACILDVAIDTQNLSCLKDLRSVQALYACASLTGSVPPIPNSRAKVFAAASRHVIDHFLATLAENYVPPPASHSPIKEPALLQVLAAATNAPVSKPEDMLDRALYQRVNLLESKTTASRWKIIVGSGMRAMSIGRTASTSTRKAPAAGAIVEAVESAALGTTSGWCTIYTAYEAFQQNNSATLDEFKTAIAKAAAKDLVELAPLDVPSMYTADARQKSALDVGGMTFYRVRLPR